MANLSRANQRQFGFTLIELAIALVIIAFMSAGAILFARIQSERTQMSETKTAIEEAREALLNYAAVNGVLPCPADNTTGIRRASCNTGATRRGLVPWSDLGIQGADAWNRRLAYQVTANLTDSTSISLTTVGTVAIREKSGATTNLVAAEAVAFSVWSYGSNGYYATTLDGTKISAPPANHTDEIANRPTSVTEIISHPRTDVGSTGGEFDDVVSWTSRYVLLGRMIEAGKQIKQ